jgi:hypothetical protein
VRTDYRVNGIRRPAAGRHWRDFKVLEPWQHPLPVGSQHFEKPRALVWMDQDLRGWDLSARGEHQTRIQAISKRLLWSAPRHGGMVRESCQPSDEGELHVHEQLEDAREWGEVLNRG